MGRMARIGAGALVMSLAIGVAGPAQAAKKTNTKKLSPTTAQKISKDLGSRSPGIYLDRKSGNMVVTVTDARAAARVRAAGGIARIVANSGAVIRGIYELLRDRATVKGTAWGYDPIRNRVVLSVDETVSDGDRALLRRIVARLGKAVHVEIIPPITTLISGGDAVLGGGARCSLGFAVRRGGVDHFLTAGHCTQIISTWTTPGAVTVNSNYPGDDMGLARHTSTVARPGNVSLYNGTFQEITTAANAVVGQAVRRSGSTTGLRSGTVTAVNQTVNYGGGNIVSGLVRTNACAQPGDSGGPFFAGTTALGLTSGGSGNCTSGGTTFFQPVVEALSRYSATVY